MSTDLDPHDHERLKELYQLCATRDKYLSSPCWECPLHPKPESVFLCPGLISGRDMLDVAYRAVLKHL